MARLPEIPVENTETPQIRSSVSGAEVAAASPFALAANAFGAASKIADHYEQGVALGQTTQELQDAETNALSLSQKAKGDPNVFATSWQSYVNEKLPGVPQPYQAEIGAKLTEIGGRYQRQIMGDTYQRDQKVAADSVSARQDTLLTQMTDLAQQGQTATPQYQSMHNEYVGIINDKVKNPFFAYSQDHADLDKASAEDQLVGASVSGELSRVYQKDGFAAAQTRAQEIYNDNSNGLSAVQKLKAIQTGLKSVRSLYEQDSSARAQFTADSTAMIESVKAGQTSPDDPTVADMMNIADTLKMPSRKLDLANAVAVARTLPMKSMGLSDRVAYGQALLTGPTDAAGLLKSEEGFKSSAYYDVNAYRTGYGSDTITKADGTVEKVTPETTVTQADAERDLQRRIGQTAGGIASTIGQDQWNALPDNAKTGLVSVAYNYGTLPVSVAAAAKTGDVQAIAKAVSALPDNPQRRQREAAVIAASPSTSPTTGAALATAMSQAAIPAIKASVAEGLTTAIAGDKTVLDRADRPLDDGEVKALITAARMVGDDKTSSEVEAVLARNSVVAAQLGMPVGDQQTLIDQLHAPGAGDPVIRAAMADQAEKTHTRMADLLDKDPRALGIELGLFKPGPVVDSTNLAQAPQILASRIPDMEMLARTEQSGPLSVLRPDEVKTIKGGMWSSDPTQRSQAMVAADWLYRQNPQTFTHDFTTEDVKRLQDYQALAPILPPDELSARLNPTQDPKLMEATRTVEEAGRKLASDAAPGNAKNFIGINQVLNGVATRNWWQEKITGSGKPAAPADPIASQQLMTDFYNLFGERYAVSGSVDTAKAQALDRLKAKWGTTDVNSSGSTVMAYPPERQYPIVNGDHAWMGKQLQQFAEQQSPGSTGHTVIETPQTESDIAAGRPPSYNIGVVDKNGVYRLLTDPTGKSLNVRFDAQQALADARSQFAAKRAVTAPAPGTSVVPEVTPFGSRSARIPAPASAEPTTP